MDVLAHFFWTFAIFFRRKKERWLAALFGVMPDLLSFGPHFLLSLFAESWGFGGRTALANIPGYIFLLYNITHSFVVFLVVFLLMYVFARKVYWPLAGWGLHIAIDIPTHSKAFFATPFLWPVSGFTVEGVSWGTPWFLMVNYAALVVVYSYLFYAYYKGKKNSNKNQRNQSTYIKSH